MRGRGGRFALSRMKSLQSVQLLAVEPLAQRRTEFPFDVYPQE
jgi:hypothetical protein